MVESILRVRFGFVDDELSGAICASPKGRRQGRTQQRFAIAPMLQLPPEELTRLLFNLSREELLVWFGGCILAGRGFTRRQARKGRKVSKSAIWFCG
jgi:hypothetical protein